MIRSRNSAAEIAVTDRAALVISDQTTNVFNTRHAAGGVAVGYCTAVSPDKASGDMFRTRNGHAAANKSYVIYRPAGHSKHADTSTVSFVNGKTADGVVRSVESATKIGAGITDRRKTQP